MLGWARSRNPVVTMAIVIQLVIIAGILLWGTELGAAATDSLPVVSPGTLIAARITAWVSDPAWHVAPTLTVGQQTWTVGLSASREPTDADAEAVVVLWGAAQLGDPHPFFKPLSAARPGSYLTVQVPKSQAGTYTGSFFSGSAISAQVFVVTARDLYASYATSEAIIPVEGAAPPSLYATTSSGWAAYVPPIGVAGISLPGACRAAPGMLPAAIASAMGHAGRRPWYGTTCPTPTPTVQLDLGENETLGSSTLPQTSQVPTNGDPVWSHPGDSSGSTLAGYLNGFWINVNDPAIAAAAQRDLLFSGVLYGIGGGLIAAWLIAGVTYTVAHAPTGRRSKAPSSEPDETDRTDGTDAAAQAPAAADHSGDSKRTIE